MWLYLAFLFVALPLCELAILIHLGRWSQSVATPIALVILTGIVGATLARQQGLRTWSRIQQAVQAGRGPERELVEGLLILIAGAVLITPGLLTDAFGFALLIPGVRKRLVSRLTVYFTSRMVRTHHHMRGAPPTPDIIDMPED